MKRAVACAGLVALAACHSPEASRVRGGGPGADTGNRTDVVVMHEGSRPYANTPHLIPGPPTPVGPADQAAGLKR